MTTSAGTGSEGFYNTDGTLQDGKVKALTRTYMQATQGVLKSMKFNTETSDFYALFKVDTSIQQPSIAYFSEYYYYQQGVDVSVYDYSGVRLSEQQGDFTLDLSQPNYVKVQVKNAAFDGHILSIQLTKKHLGGEGVPVEERKPLFF